MAIVAAGAETITIIRFDTTFAWRPRRAWR